MIIGHQKEQEIIRKILREYDRGAFMLIGPEGIGKFHTIKNIVEDEKIEDKLIIDSKEHILKLHTANLLQKLLNLSTDKKRIIVVDDAHKLNREAQNSLLKILEEIKTKALIFFVTHRPYRILATIRSRAQKIIFKSIPNSEIEEFLIKKGLKKETIKILLKLFPGQIGKILKTLENKEIFNFLVKIYNGEDDFEKIYKIMTLDDKIDLKEILIYFIHIERLNLLSGNSRSIYKIKFLENIYQDSDYSLNKTIQISNILLNLNG